MFGSNWLSSFDWSRLVKSTGNVCDSEGLCVPASATITVRSNDPDSPEQTFRVVANGAPVDPSGDSTTDGPRTGGVKNLEPPPSDNAGCSTAAAGAGFGSRSTPGLAGLLLGLGLVLGARRRRR